MLAPDCKAIHYMAQTLKIINDDIKAGIDGIETDVRVTSDGVYVLQHTATINSVDISQLTYSECKAGNSALLTLNEVLAIQKEHNLIAVYESKINDSHAHNIVDAIVNSGVNLEDTFIEPHAKNLTSNYTGYDSRINVVWKNGTVSDTGIADAAQYLTGHNKVVFSINLYLEHQKDFDDSWVEKMRSLGLGLAADPVASENGAELYSQYPFDQVWGPANIVVPMRDKYRQRDFLGAYDIDGEGLSIVYTNTGSTITYLFDVNGNSILP